MDVCQRLRPVLFRMAEGEATPEEAIDVARHVSDCTACRILMAREQRLADVLGGLRDSLEVERGFVDSILARLPARPPRTRRAKQSRRGLKLAGVVGGLSFLTGALASRALHLGAPGGSVPSLPRVSADTAEGLTATLLEAARAVSLALAQIGSMPSLPSGSLRFALMAGFQGLAMAALLAFLTLVALGFAARSLSRR